MGRNLLSVFPNAMVLTGGTVEKGELVVRGTCTSKDVGLDLPRLERIEAALAAYVKDGPLHHAKNLKEVDQK